MQSFPIDSYLFWVMGFDAPAPRQPAANDQPAEPVAPPAWMCEAALADQTAFTADA